VNRQFQAPRPNALWLSDCACIATWRGFVCVAFVIEGDGLVHHGDRGVQGRSKYTERLAEAGIARSIDSVGDSYDYALAATIDALYKTETIRQRGPRQDLEDVEFATLEWVD
jgi:transposase InsO family protein